MDNRPIGIFDSGVGGLTVLREIIKSVPNEDIIYFGDTARVPYGPRDLIEVKKFAFKITEFLCKLNVKMIVVACNTSTAAALDDLTKEFNLPIIGVIEPGAKTAAQQTKNGRVGVIATKGTVESNAYKIAINKINPSIELFQVAAPLLVEYIERGTLNSKSLHSMVIEYIKPLNDNLIDVLILGCTHFPLIEDDIKSCCKESTIVINSAVATALDVKKILENKEIGTDTRSNPARTFYETGSESRFLEVGKRFLGSAIEEVKKVDLTL